MSDKRHKLPLWQYKTTTYDRSDGTVWREETSRWIKLEELGDTEWELCQINGHDRYDTAWAIFRRRVTQGEHEDKPAAMDPLEMVNKLIRYYKPTWFYQMGKVGYECSWCRAVVLHPRQFSDPEQHDPECALMEAMALVAEREAQ